jgi:DeoR/GlpR family transcriptional regulator of sugar metabolism
VAESGPRRDTAARRATILELLSATGYLRTSEVAERLAISPMTARRDLKRLADEGVAASVRGGIRIASVEEQAPTEYERRLGAEPGAKTVIGLIGAGLISAHDVIALDAGTTAYQVARNLPAEFEGIVVTHSIPVMHLLAERPSGRVIALGGELFRPSKALVGSIPVANLQHLRVSTLFLGAAGIDSNGVFVAADSERGVKQALMDIADRVVLVSDHSKLTTRAPVLLCDWSRIDTFVCDRALKAEFTARLATSGVQVLTPAQQTATGA